MAYCTPAQLVDGPGRITELTELFQLASDALLRATIDGTSRADWDAGEIAAADAALATINAEINQAGAEIDARLAVRGYALPIDSTAYPIVRLWARAIARYHLHPQRERTDSGETFRIERDYRETRAALDLVAAGKLGLGAGDPLTVPAPGTGGGPTHVAPARVFDRDSLAGY